MYCENAAVDFMCSNQSEFKKYNVVKKKHCMQIATVISVINLGLLVVALFRGQAADFRGI